MSAMRIHLWAPGFSVFGGGIAAFSGELAVALRDGGHDTVLWGRDDRDGEWAGLRLRGTGAMPRKTRATAFAARILAAACAERPGLVISSHLNFGPVASLARRLAAIPYALVAHGIDVDPGLSAARRRALAGADGVWAVSRWTAGRLRSLDVPGERIRLLPNTVSDAEFFPAPRSTALQQRYGIAPDEKVVLTVARLETGEAYKGYDKVLQAIPAVSNAVGKVRYLVVGKGGDAARLRQMASDLGIAGNLTLCGFVPQAELADHYRLADVFAMPSDGEGFGIVFLEAMACGVPVLGGNRDGTVDALDDGKLGRLVDPRDAAAIAGGLVELLQGKGPALWFHPGALREACLQRHGRKAFRGHLREALLALAR